jgi:hypothetical protein
MAEATPATSLSDGPRMEATMHKRAALLATAFSAAASTSSGVISLYFSTGTSEMLDWEQ